MKKKFSYSGVIVVLLSLGLMLYYYLIFRHAAEIKMQQQSSKSNVQ